MSSRITLVWATAFKRLIKRRISDEEKIEKFLQYCNDQEAKLNKAWNERQKVLKKERAALLAAISK